MANSDPLTINCDVLIVGAGFSGIAALYRARKLGLKAKVLEAGNELGGVWNWNRYPGARVDSEYPFYQLNIPEVYGGWSFSQRFPNHVELRRYMLHVDKVLDVSKDVVFGTMVVGAQYETHEALWTLRTSSGLVTKSKYLVLASGLLHRRHTPDFPGLESYKGLLCHSGSWPGELDCRRKKVAVIGAGATAVQIIQEISKETAAGGSLTVFMRRPSYCLPMVQRTFQPTEDVAWKAYFPTLFRNGRRSFGGFPVQGPGCNALDVSTEEREAYLEVLWHRGAFSLLNSNYNDLYFGSKGNRAIYDFWAEKTRSRITDPAKKNLMAPKEPPYAFGTKRNPLEQDFYECIDMKHVEVVDLNNDPIKELTVSGISTTSRDRDFDVIILATGFDSFTGSMTNMGLKSKDGIDLSAIWRDGVSTYLGLMIRGFPNAFMIYSPHAPNALSNGPTIIECQADLIFETISRLEAQNATSIEPTEQAQEEWKALINAMNEKTLLPQTNSWWTGGNIPGKKAETLTFVAGIDTYEQMCREKLEKWEGLEIKASS